MEYISVGPEYYTLYGKEFDSMLTLSSGLISFMRSCCRVLEVKLALFLFDDRALTPGRKRGSPVSFRRGLLFRLQPVELLVVERTADEEDLGLGDTFPLLSTDSSSEIIQKSIRNRYGNFRFCP